jgi:hypothetical protein
MIILKRMKKNEDGAAIIQNFDFSRPGTDGTT